MGVVIKRVINYS